MYPTCHLCFMESQLDSGCSTSVMALCFIGNEAISQDVTLSMCQLVAVMKGMRMGYWERGHSGFWLDKSLMAASAKMRDLNTKPVNASM